MRPLVTAVSVVAVLAAGIFAVGCGSSDSNSSSTKTTTVPAGKLGASSAPVKLGYYAGVDCKGHSCSSYYSHASEGFTSYCKPGKDSHGNVIWPNTKYHSSYDDGHGNEYNFVCFKLVTDRNLKDFYYAGTRIIKSINVNYDQFPETCDNGWCISGEWSNTTKMDGRVRNPRSVYADYKAQWVSGL